MCVIPSLPGWQNGSNGCADSPLKPVSRTSATTTRYRELKLRLKLDLDSDFPMISVLCTANIVIDLCPSSLTLRLSHTVSQKIAIIMADGWIYSTAGSRGVD
jgi:hypothetical protein